MKKSILKKSMAYLLVLCLALGNFSLAFAGEREETDSKMARSVHGSGQITHDDTTITGLAVDESGNSYTIGNTKAGDYPVMPEGNGNAVAELKQVFVSKYDSNMNRTHSLVLSGSTKKVGTYGQETCSYMAGDQFAVNGALVLQGDSVYMGVKKDIERSMVEKEAIAHDSGCLCQEWSFFDENCAENLGCTCQACAAYDQEAAKFKKGKSSEIVVYQLNKQLDLSSAKIVVAATNAEKADVRGMAVGTDGSVYLCGGTGDNAPGELAFSQGVTPLFGFQDFTAKNGTTRTAGSRGYLAKVDLASEKTVAATYFGGAAQSNNSDGSNMWDVVLDGQQNVYVTGDIRGKTLPFTPDEKAFTFDDLGSDTDNNGYVAKFDPNISKINGFTYIGGSGSENGTKLAIKKDTLYLGGQTTSKNLPGTENACQDKNSSSNSYSSMFVARMPLSLDVKGGNFAATYFGSAGRDDTFGMSLGQNSVYLTGSAGSSSTFPITDGSTGKVVVSKLPLSLKGTKYTSTIIESDSTYSYYNCRQAIEVGKTVYVAGNLGSRTVFVNQYDASLAHSAVINVRGTVNSTGGSNAKYVGEGAKVEISLNFDTYVNVKGTPKIKLNCGNDAYAMYKSGSGTKALLFEYTVKKGDKGQGALNYEDANAIVLNQGTILCASGGSPADVNLMLPEPTDTQGSMLYNKIYIKTDDSKAVQVDTTAKDGLYGQGAEIPIVVTFDAAISSINTTEGTPYINLTSGGKAILKGQNMNNNPKELLFVYVVGAGDDVQKLNYTGEDALVLNGGTLVDIFGQPVQKALPHPSDEKNLLNGKNIQVSNQAVRVMNVWADGTKAYKAGDQVDIKVRFSKPVTTTGEMKLLLNSSVGYERAEGVAQAVSNLDTLDFVYTVKDGDNTTSEEPLNYTNTESLLFVGAGEITAGNKGVSLALPAVESENSLKSSKVIIDTAAPAKPTHKVHDGKSSNHYKAGETFSMKFTFREPVMVSAKGEIPYIEIPNLGNEKMHYASGSGTKELIFSYTVKEGDTIDSTDGLGFSTSASNPNKILPENSICDVAGNPVPQMFTAPSMINPYKSIRFDTTAPAWQDTNPQMTATPADTQISLSWGTATDTPTANKDKYYLYRKSAGADVQIYSDKATTYKDTTAVKGIPYTYTLVFKDKAGNETTKLTVSTKIAGDKPDTDTAKPYWASGTTLACQRLTAHTARIVWGKEKAFDDQSGVKEFRIYNNSKLIATAPAIADSVVIDGLEFGKSYYGYKVEIVDGNDNRSEKLSLTIPTEYAALTVVDKKGKVYKEFALAELAALAENKRYSGKSNKDGAIYSSWYGATGVTLRKIMEASGVKEFGNLYVESMDGTGLSFHKELLSADRFYFPHDYKDGNQIKVEPMVSLYYVEDQTGNVEPDFAGETVRPTGLSRFFYGQLAPNDYNRTYFVKDVARLVVTTDLDASPTVTLKGEAEMSMLKGETFQDPGVTAVDIQGNTISSKNVSLKIVNSQGTGVTMAQMENTSGTYTITYLVVDTKGNKATVTRKVTVLGVIVPSGIYQGSIGSGAGYTVSNQGIPTAKVTQDMDMLNLSVHLDAVKKYGVSQSIVFVHMRGNKFINISSVDRDVKSTLTVGVGIPNVRANDEVKLFIVDRIDVEHKGSEILFQ